MVEIMALPGWNVNDTPLDVWADGFRGQGLDVAITRESTGVSWVDVTALGLRGYAVMEGKTVEAINFELSAPDPGPARDALTRVAAALAWELHEDDEGEDGDD